MDLKERLRIVIERSGLTLPAFASKVGVSKNTLVNYRNGATTPNVRFLEKVCMEFEVSREWLVLGLGSFEPTEALVPTQPLERSRPDPDALRSIILLVESGLSRRNARMTPAKKAELIALLHEHFADRGMEVREETVERWLGLVL